MQQLKTRGRQAAAFVVTAALPALALADDDLLTQAGTELGGLKAGIIGFGVVVIGIAIALKTINIGSRAVNKA